ncbi:WD repeat-containing protein 70 isoform X2 [Peromyscus californicus insignis]|uniref:WD repeat-containing protein 70 isoform X2 n=1 Tax=Peromyscus californicus insignis TaxID=564181 RepID=UPI0022A6E1D6|nr:WD repeat-containing protein 70 isoform X2 [Peromyscus californicus insignis]
MGMRSRQRVPSLPLGGERPKASLPRADRPLLATRTGRRYFLSGLPGVARCLRGCFCRGCGARSAMEQSGPGEVPGADAAGPDPQLAVTMGFTGFGKKARTFDLEAMFEQTRRTAVERSRKTLAEPVFGRLGQRWLSPLLVDPDSIEHCDMH